jgi:alpha-D-xyloside xylohydrolase
VPWVYDEEAVDVVRFFTKLKARLMPYLYANAIYTSKTGIPMMRSMVLEFTEDKNCHYLDKQYMMGDSLLVAPVFNDESIAEYYLPEGNWTNFFTGRKRKGGKWYTEKVGYLDIPLWVKENSAIALGNRDDRPDYDYSKDNEIRVYELSDKATAEIYNDKNKKVYDFVAEKTGSGIKIELKSVSKTMSKTASKATVRLVNTVMTGKGAEIDGKDTVVRITADIPVLLKV